MLVFTAGLIFGAGLGFIYALMGSTVSASAAFALGRWLTRDAVRFVAGSRLNRVSARLVRRGVLPVARLRLVPAAPFAVTNLVAGAARVDFRDFLLGTLLALAPGVLATTLLADRLAAAMRVPDAAHFAPLAGALLLLPVVGPALQWLLGPAAAPGRRGADGA